MSARDRRGRAIEGVDPEPQAPALADADFESACSAVSGFVAKFVTPLAQVGDALAKGAQLSGHLREQTARMSALMQEITMLETERRDAAEAFARDQAQQEQERARLEAALRDLRADLDRAQRAHAARRTEMDAEAEVQREQAAAEHAAMLAAHRQEAADLEAQLGLLRAEKERIGRLFAAA